jgi:uncharacterized protein (TIGR04255 family)
MPNVKKYPIKINSLPVIDAVCEVRFTSPFPVDMISGLLADKLGISDIAKIEPQPILQVPEHIRNKDENLKYLPHYKAVIDGFTVQFGAQILAVSSPIPYCGWTKFQEKIQWYILNNLHHKVFESVTRIGYRVINLFESDVLTLIENPKKPSLTFDRLQYNYTEIFKTNDTVIKIGMADAVAARVGEVLKTGSAIDIDVSVDGKLGKESAIISNHIEEVHGIEKKSFFDILTNEQIKKMEPEYE